jgi:hypothetical protein
MRPRLPIMLSMVVLDKLELDDSETSQGILQLTVLVVIMYDCLTIFNLHGDAAALTTNLTLNGQMSQSTITQASHR